MAGACLPYNTTRRHRPHPRAHRCSFRPCTRVWHPGHSPQTHPGPPLLPLLGSSQQPCPEDAAFPPSHTKTERESDLPKVTQVRGGGRDLNAGLFDSHTQPVPPPLDRCLVQGWAPSEPMGANGMPHATSAAASGEERPPSHRGP